MAIVQLDKHTAELIAAGEVVERPSSVVKELCENAIDAGATSVTVEIEGGGTRSIQVADNGCGIEKVDLRLAFMRHATSKLRTAADLDAIGTLGFRGEALASIASVARVHLLTKHDEDEYASELLVEGGALGHVQPAARGRGTTITVQDLFFNTPARMKFLKKDASEGSFVTETMNRLALSHPEVAFRYSREGKEVFATPGDGQLASAAYSVLGAAFAKELVAVDSGDENAYRVWGLVTPPRAMRASRAMQFFFVNGRFVKNRTMMAALEQAYRGMAMGGRFPGGVLFLQLPAELVDVNVHPAKTEVRFAHEQDVFQTCYRAVKTALADASAAHAQFRFGQSPKGKAEMEEPGMAGQSSAPAPQETGAAVSGPDAVASGQAPGRRPAAPVPSAATSPTAAPAEGVASSTPSYGVVQRYNQMVKNTAETAETLASEAAFIPYTTSRDVVVEFGAAAQNVSPPKATARPDILAEAPPQEAEPPSRQPGVFVAPNAQQQSLELHEDCIELRVLGELFKTYIVAEAQNTLCLIDKHAAHERLLYEKLSAARGQAAVQQLLAPVNVSLSAEEKNALLQSEEALRQAGLEVEEFGGNTVLVRGVPADVAPDDIEDLVTEVAARLAVNAKDSLNEKTEWVLHSMACRAAVKAGDTSSGADLLQLAKQILNGEIPPFCPHGRPVVLEISRKELEKQFGRLG